MERDFLKWLNHCHGSQDVQVSFQGNTKTFVTDKVWLSVPQSILPRPTPLLTLCRCNAEQGKTYTKFERITSAQKTYKIGQPVKMDILPKKDILGHISGFLLRGTHEQDNVSGTSGINGRIAVTIVCAVPSSGSTRSPPTPGTPPLHPQPISPRTNVLQWPKTGTGPTIRRLSDLLSKMDEIVLTE